LISSCPLHESRVCSGASDEMQHEQDQTYDQDDVNEAGGYVKCKEPKQPENDQDCGDEPKHAPPR
jgi:hypothetical protein